MSYTRVCAGIALATFLSHGLAAQTTVTVHVVAHDAKVIGTAVGGARVIIRNAVTGEELASGVTQGGTGDTRRIVEEPHARGAALYDTPGAAAYVATIAVDTPTVVEVLAEGPGNYPQAIQRASATFLLVPGQDVTGDGIVLELHGFIVELLAPRAARAAVDVPVRARIRMMCGCTFTAGGLWDPARMTVVARIYEGANLLREVPLAFTGEENIWGGTISTTGLPTGAHLVVIAADAERANFGKSDELVLF
jgi:hypothetical protein